MVASPYWVLILNSSSSSERTCPTNFSPFLLVISAVSAKNSDLGILNSPDSVASETIFSSTLIISPSLIEPSLK